MDGSDACEACGRHSVDRSLEDRAAVADVITAYAAAIDDQRADAVADLFTEDCVFRVFEGSKGEARGRDGVSSLVARLLSTFAATSHHVSNIRVDLTGDDAARATTYLYAWHRFLEERPDGLLWARYEDELVRRGGRWLFTRRTLRVTGEQDFAFRWIGPRG
ncbi:nuclear transport factor 2 family protein [Nocardioides terrigena]|uniref:nuclear transport factor 2 family protein n=1 Tax=Nocardioides terrigena TaxID=424797 RepID=UPI002279D9F5|nr:nuclear transport factor 2 family protein [Nocardioides terrigena]